MKAAAIKKGKALSKVSVKKNPQKKLKTVKQKKSQKKLTKLKGAAKETEKVNDKNDNLFDESNDESLMDEDDIDDSPVEVETKGTGKKLKKKQKTKGKKEKSKDDVKKHKEQLENLKNIDPEFYEFLKKNDKKLLSFNIDDTDEEFGDESDGEREAAREIGLDDDDDGDDEDMELEHKPSGTLEAGSDEEDFNDIVEDEGEEGTNITLKLLQTWQDELQSDNVPVETIRKSIQAFSSALFSLSGVPSKGAIYKVEGGPVFNGIIQLCVIYLQPAIYKFLKVSPKSKQPIHKSKKWRKVKSCLRIYLSDLSRLLEHATSANILSVLLKHLHRISSIVSSFPTISKPIMKRLINLWSTGEETVRILSFLNILKITRDQQGLLLNHVLKSMYLCYVRNSKFVNPQSLPAINFMRQSLVEMFALDLTLSYQHAFLFIRQLAIHLRNALILKKKDSMQAVYNWQFINSLRLWGDLLGSTANKPQLQPLIYPLGTITIGVIKLVPTAQFFPLRFHCIRVLISLSKATHTFIPALPFILEVLNSNTFNKKHTVVSMKPMQFTCLLRLTKPQMAENGFRDEVIENVCGLLLEYLEHESCSLAFPDLVVPAVVTLKNYLKKCKNANYVRKLKQILDKVMETSKLIEDERSKITFTLQDKNLIQSWETQIREKGTPLSIYFSSWLKTYETKRKRQAANTDDINDYNIPVIKRKRIDDGNQEKIVKDGPVELFPSDSEDEQLNAGGTGKEVKDAQKVKKKKKTKKIVKNIESKADADDDDNFDDDGVDIVKDLDLDDW